MYNVFNLPPNCNSAVAWKLSPSRRLTTHWYIPLSSRPTSDINRVSPDRLDDGNWRPSLYHVICCKPIGNPLLVTEQRNSAEPPIWMLNILGITSTCKGAVIVNRSSALASPPVFDTKHLYVPASSLVTASIANTGPSTRIRGPLITVSDSMLLFENHLHCKQIMIAKIHWWDENKANEHPMQVQ